VVRLYIVLLLDIATLGAVIHISIHLINGILISMKLREEQFVQQHGGFLPTSARKLVSTKKEEKWYKQKKILIQVFGSD
jgi:hypothetical protein